MAYDPTRHHRRSIRLKGYDYANTGAYFITICTIGRGEIFGTVASGEIALNGWGKIAARCWLALAARYPYVFLDEWTVMPDHLHGILCLQAEPDDRRSALQIRAEEHTTFKRKSVGRLVGVYKTISTKEINQLRRKPNLAVWQRNYYEHIIRNEADMERIRRYIRSNPARWQ